MPVNPVGDMAQQFNAMRNTSVIKSDLARLSESMSTGNVADITRHLNGETTLLSGVNYSLSQLASYTVAGRETEQRLANMQIVLGQLDSASQKTSSQLLLVSNNSSSDQVTEAARAARSTFDTMVNLLNTRVGDRALFGGAKVANAPLASATDMLADIQIAIGGATSQAAISAAVLDWFDNPAGGFATMGYLGDTGPAVKKRLSDSTTVTIDARADDPAIRDALKFAALAAVTHEMSGLDVGTRSGLLQESGIGLFSTTSALVGVQSRIGFVEETVSREITEMSAESTALAIAKNDLVAADPFEAASRLQAVQLQLETHYAVTARMSQLSLLSFI
ncbi:flagellin [Yoonia maritima]|uniref:flagellin n=1 Tax=Yoonia maritima TaxID=1435347 RepID=UPI003734FA96